MRLFRKPQCQRSRRLLAAEILERRALPTSFLWLDFDGGSVTQARADDIILPNGGPVAVPKFDLTTLGFGGQEKQVENYVLNFVREDYAAYDIKIGFNPPFPEPYTTVYVGGAPSLINKTNLYGIASTIDVGNKHEIPNGTWDPDQWDIALIFPEEWSLTGFSGTVQQFSEQLAEVISHEAAHTFGLRHLVDSPHSIMSATAPPGQFISFGIGDLQDTTEGAGSQDSALKLGQNLGWSDDPAVHYGTDTASATPIGTDDHLRGVLRNWTDADFFKLTATSGVSYRLAIHTDGFANLDSFLTILDSTGATVTTDDNSGDGVHDARLSFTATYSGTYYVKVSSAGGASSGSYLLDVTDDASLTPNISTAAALAFGSVVIGQSKTLPLTLSNTGNETLDLSTLAITGPFAVSPLLTMSNALDDLMLEPGETTTLQVTYAPTAHGAQAGTLDFTSNDSTPPSVGLSGSGVDLIQSATNNKTYTFTDQTGQLVTLKYSGAGNASIVFTDSNGVGVNISSVTFSGNSGKTKWSVSATAPTSLGIITANTGAGFNALNLNANVTSLTVTGVVTKLTVGGELDGLAITAGGVGKLTVGSLDGVVNIAGSVSSFRVNGAADGPITIDAIGAATANIGKFLFGGAVGNDITVDGSVGSFTAVGAYSSGSLIVSASLGKLQAASLDLTTLAVGYGKDGAAGGVGDNADFGGTLTLLQTVSGDLWVDALRVKGAIGKVISAAQLGEAGKTLTSASGGIALLQAVGDINFNITATGGVIAKILTVSAGHTADGDLNGHVTAAAIQSVVLEGVLGLGSTFLPAPLALVVDSDGDGL